MAKWIVLALIALTALEDAATDSPRQCSKGCKNAPVGDFKFGAEPGHTYVYNFEATTETSVPGAAVTAEDEVAGGQKKPGGQRLHVSAQAEVYAGAGCDHVMRLLHVQVTGADGKKFQEFPSCEKHPLGFSWNNGILGDQLCVEEGDNPSNVNVKRAVLSLLQISKVQSSGSATLSETDIFGTCPTDFTFYEDGGAIKVTKRRNLNRCAHREDIHHTFLSTSFDGPSDLKSTPLLQSNLQVEQTIKDKLIVSAVGHEEYLYRPFSNGASGAHTTVTTKLTLVKHQPGPAPPVTDGHSKPIIFDAHKWNYGGGNPEDQATVAIIANSLKALEKSVSGGANKESAGLFRRLVRSMRYANAECLMGVFAQAQAGTGFTSKKSAKALYLDALLQTGTGESVEAVVQLMNSKNISPDTAKLYFFGLSFVRHATRGSLKAVASLLEAPSVSSETLLGAGALVGRFCSEHRCDDSVPEFKAIVGKLAHKLGKGCKPVNRAHENEIIGALKGLQNTRKLTAEAADAIMACGINHNIPTRIRVAALDAFRGDACQPKLKKAAMEIMKNRDIDSELRIKAYLVVAECPCESVATAVKEMMDTEPINQVGSFVSSHLLSLRTSSNPDHADAKHFLGGIRPKKRYPFDIRKFSRAYEMSYSLDGLNMASSAEGNVIFSQKSFIPRSANLNLTTNLFGHSFNLFEVGVRAENVDFVLESLMGPQGYFKTHSPNEVYKESRSTFSDIAQQIKDRVKKSRGGKSKRVGRHVNREWVDAIGKKVGHSADHDDHSLDIDMHMKLFGSEVGWMNYHGNLQEMRPQAIVDKFFDTVDEGVNKAKNLKLDFNPNIAFFDTRLTYPTGAGFSLTLDAAAYSSVDFKVESQLDIPAILSDPGNANFRVKLLPSASVEVSGSMIVDAFSNVMAGLEVRGTVHSSTGLDVDLKMLENGHGIEVKLGVPKPKQEIFSFQSEVLSVTREKGHAPVSTPLKFNRNRKDYHGCFDQLTPATGVVICGDVGFPWDGVSSVILPKANQALFPLDGPIKASLHLEKEDDKLTHYYFRALYSEKGPHKKSFEMKFDTPNSSQDRAVQVLFEGDCETDKIAKVNVKTPWVKFIVEGALINNEKEHSLSGKFVHDGNEYKARLGLVVKSASGNKKVYAPHLDVVYPEKKKPPGKAPKGKKPSSKGLTIEGTITIERDDNTHLHMYTFDGVNVVTPKGKFGLDGKIGRDDPHTYSTDMKLKYDDLKHYFGFKGKVHESVMTGKIDNFGITSEAEFTASQIPDFGFSIKHNLQSTPHKVENTFDLVHGPDLQSDVAHLHISNMYVYKYTSSDEFEFSTDNKVTYPLMGLESKLNAAATRTHVHYDMEVKYEKHVVDSELDFKLGKSIQEGYDFKWGVVAFGSGFQLNSKRVVTSPKSSKVDVCLELKPGGRKYTIKSDLTHLYEGAKNFDMRANTVMSIPGYSDFRLDGGAAVNPATFKSHLEFHVGDVCHVNLKANGELGSDGMCKSAQWSVLLLKYIDGSGHYSADGHSNKGDFVVSLVGVDRKMKGEFSSVHPGDGTCKTLIDFFWNADKDPSKKIHIESVNILPKGNNVLDTKNKFVFIDQTTRFDAKITQDGPLSSGSMNSAVDLYLPSGRHIYFKGQHTLHLRPSSSGDSDGDGNYALCDKGASGESCLKMKSKFTNVNTKTFTYVVSEEYMYVRHDGKDLKFTLDAKSLLKGEVLESEGKGFVGGSLLGANAKPLTVEWGGATKKNLYDYHAVAKVGEGQSLGAKLKVDLSTNEGKTMIGDLLIEAHTMMENLKYISYGEHMTLTIQSSQNFDCVSFSELKWNDKKLKVGSKIHREGPKGAASINLSLPGQTEDYAASTEWNHDVGTPRVEGSVAFMWPQGKKVKLELQATTPKDALALHLVAYTPVQGHEKMELLINHKNIREEHAMETDVTIVASSEQKTSLHSRLEFAEHKRTLDLSYAQQGGPTNKVHVRLEKMGENLYESEIKVDWSGESLTAESAVRIDSVEDFAFHGYLDSTNLKVKKWSIDIASKEGGAKGAKGGGSGKKLVFTAKTGEEVVFQGSTSYSYKQEGNTLTYEGLGQVKMGGETRNANFKLFTKTLSAKDNGETGLETKVNFAVTSSKGAKHIVIGEGKLSNKELRLYNSYCKDGNVCSFVEAYSKVKFEDLDHDMSHDFALVLDLKELINLFPISVKGSTHRTGEFNLDHKMEVDFDKGVSKYSYHLYLKEDDIGAILVLPKRTMAAIGTMHVEEAGKKEGGVGGLHADITVWLDKERHPELKTTGSILIDVTEHEDSVKFMSEAKLTHPSLGKDLAIRGQAMVGAKDTCWDSKVEFDVFAKKEQMIVTSLKLHHEPVQGGGHNMTALMDIKGQNVDVEWVSHAAYTARTLGAGTFATYLNAKKERRDVGVLLRVSPESVYFLVKAPTCEIVRVDVKTDLSEAKQVITSEICLMGTHTHIDTVEFRGFNTFKYHSHEKGTPNEQFQVHGSLLWGKAMEMHANRLKGGQKEVLAHLNVALDDEHFFDVKHTWEQEKIKTYLSDVKNDFTYLAEEGRKMSTIMGAELEADGKAALELLKKSTPNIKPLLASYQTQLKELKEEIMSDAHVSHMLTSVNNALKAVAETFSQTIEKISHLSEEFLQTWNSYWEKVIVFYEKMMKMVGESLGKIMTALTEGCEKFSHYAVEVFEKFLDFLHQFSAEFKAIGKVIVQFIQDVARTIAKLLDEVKHRFEEMKAVTMEHLKAIPAYDFIKEYYDELMVTLPRTLQELLVETMGTLKESSPTEEVREFLQGLESYVDKIIKKAERDDEKEIKHLYDLFVKAVKSLRELVKSHVPDYNKDMSLSQFQLSLWPLGFSPQPLTISMNDIYRLPFFFAARFTPFFMKLEDFPTPSELFFAYRPTPERGLLPPHSAYGFIVGGEHFFTFDNKHFTLSGCACDYVLAQDFEDGNFSVVGHLQNGKLESISLVDSNEVIELSHDLKVKVNGQPVELPVQHKTISAWHEFDTVNIKTSYGAKVICDKRYKGGMCAVRVNGYYFGKTRGLLGTVNNEPYDDFLMPDGKVAPSVDKFANSWKVDPSCPDVAAQTHHHEHVDKCSNIFAGYSSMRACFPIVNPAGFRDACDAHVDMHNGDPCEVAAAYAVACYYEGIRVPVPNQCAQCMLGGNPVDQGYSVSLKAPQGKADIMLVVEQVPENEALFKDLLVPLAAALTNDLKAYKITDVRFLLVGFGGKNRWPSLFTVNGQFGFDGKGDNVKFEGLKPGDDKILTDDLPNSTKDYLRQLDRMKKLFDVEIGNTRYAEAFKLVRDFEFRPGAAKTVVALLNTRCLYSPLPISSQALRLFIQKKQYEMAGVSFHILSPMEFSSSTRDKKQIKQVVGFDKNHVYSLSDAKKKVPEGDAEFKKDLKYDSDVCADFAQDTNGGAYSTHSFKELPKPAFKKQFMQVVSQRIAQSLSPELTEDCTCQLYHGFHPVSRCRVTSRKEFAKITKTVKG